jgi:hypothetical protein
MSRRFTLREAESLLPRIGGLLEEALKVKSAYQEAERAFSAITQRIMMLGGVALDRKRAAEARLARDHAGELLKKDLDLIQETGCVVKDLDIGLVDFPTLFRGREVFLCWKLGEPSIGFWHGTDEGFAGRKPIDEAFLSEHRGDTAQ